MRLGKLEPPGNCGVIEGHHGWVQQSHLAWCTLFSQFHPTDIGAPVYILSVPGADQHGGRGEGDDHHFLCHSGPQTGQFLCASHVFIPLYSVNILFPLRVKLISIHKLN